MTTETVTAQLLYEIAGPRYAGPGCHHPLRHDHPRRQRRTGSRADQRGAGRTTAADVEGRDGDDRRVPQRGRVRAHRSRHRRQGGPRSGAAGRLRRDWTLARTDHADAATEEEASALLHCVVRGADPKSIGRAFSGAAIELALASYPGFHVTAPPGDAEPYGEFTVAHSPPPTSTTRPSSPTARDCASTRRTKRAS